VVENNGFSLAQDALGLSRSAISAQMAALETRLGLVLCRRGRSGFALTEQGRKVYTETVRCLAALERFRSEMGVMRGKLVGELRIGLIDAIAEHPNCRIWEAIAAFNREVPDVHLSLSVIAPNQAEAALLNRQIDMAVVPNLPMNAAIELEPLFYETQYLYCGAGHALFDKAADRIKLDKIAQHAHARRSYLVTAAYQTLFAAPPSATVNTMEGLIHLILSGRFLGVMPEHSAQYWVEAGRMRALRPDVIRFDIGICLAHFLNPELSRVAQIFREMALEAHRAVRSSKRTSDALSPCPCGYEIGRDLHDRVIQSARPCVSSARRTLMNRRLFSLMLASGLLGLPSARALAGDPAPRFSFPSIDGGTLETGAWRGQPVLVVNTASMCGFSGQLADLQTLHETYGPRGLIVLAVPSDSFKQEFDDARQVKEFCALQFGITLPMTDILPVTGAQAHPFYRWLKDAHGFTPGWNFNKVLLDGEGQVVGTWGALTNPQSGVIVEAFTPLLPRS